MVASFAQSCFLAAHQCRLPALHMTLCWCSSPVAEDIVRHLLEKDPDAANEPRFPLPPMLVGLFSCFFIVSVSYSLLFALWLGPLMTSCIMVLCTACVWVGWATVKSNWMKLKTNLENFKTLPLREATLCGASAATIKLLLEVTSAAALETNGCTRDSLLMAALRKNASDGDGTGFDINRSLEAMVSDPVIKVLLEDTTTRTIRAALWTTQVEEYIPLSLAILIRAFDFLFTHPPSMYDATSHFRAVAELYASILDAIEKPNHGIEARFVARNAHSQSLKSNPLSGLRWFVQNGLTTLGDIELASSSTSDSEQRVLARWHHGGFLWAHLLERGFVGILPSTAAITIVAFACGVCSCDRCARRMQAVRANIADVIQPVRSCDRCARRMRAVRANIVDVIQPVRTRCSQHTIHQETLPPQSLLGSPPVIQFVDHADPAAQEDLGIELVNSEMWAQDVERRILAGEHIPTLAASDSLSNDEDDIFSEVSSDDSGRDYDDLHAVDNTARRNSPFERIYLVKMTRSSSALHTALDRHESLDSVRTTAQGFGQICRHRSGAHIFVQADRYSDVMKVIRQHQLRAHHVIVSESFLPLVRTAIASIPSRANIRERSLAVIAYHDSEHVYVENHGFLDDARLHNLEVATQSTSQAHHLPNPRF